MQNVSASHPWIKASALANRRASSSRSEIGDSNWICGLSAAARATRALSRPSPIRISPMGALIPAAVTASITIGQRFSGACRPAAISSVASSGNSHRSSKRARNPSSRSVGENTLSATPIGLVTTLVIPPSSSRSDKLCPAVTVTANCLSSRSRCFQNQPNCLSMVSRVAMPPNHRYA